MACQAKKCLQCGVEFNYGRSNKRFCCDKCKDKFFKGRGMAADKGLEIQKLYAEGLGCKRISKLLGISSGLISAYARRVGIGVLPPPWKKGQRKLSPQTLYERAAIDESNQPKRYVHDCPHWFSHPVYIAERMRLYYRRNSKRINARNLANPRISLKKRLRLRIWKLLKRAGVKKEQRTNELVGCSGAQLRLHIERQFKRGMSWGNMGKWHIDHIYPCSAFDLTDPYQRAQAFNWMNLRPLWAEENRRKHAKIPTGATPCLPLTVNNSDYV